MHVGGFCWNYLPRYECKHRLFLEGFFVPAIWERNKWNCPRSLSPEQRRSQLHAATAKLRADQLADGKCEHHQETSYSADPQTKSRMLDD